MRFLPILFTCAIALPCASGSSDPLSKLAGAEPGQDCLEGGDA